MVIMSLAGAGMSALCVYPGFCVMVFYDNGVVLQIYSVCITVKRDVSSLLCVSGLGVLSRTFLHLPHSLSSISPQTEHPSPHSGLPAVWRGAAIVVYTWRPSLSIPSLPMLS